MNILSVSLGRAGIDGTQYTLKEIPINSSSRNLKTLEQDFSTIPRRRPNTKFLSSREEKHFSQIQIAWGLEKRERWRLAIAVACGQKGATAPEGWESLP